MVVEPTISPSGNVLDFILTNNEERVRKVRELMPLPHCIHCPTYCNFIFHGSQPDVNVTRRVWHKGNYSMINTYLQSIDWDYELPYLDVDQMYSRILAILHPMIERYILILDSYTHKTPSCNWKPSRQLKIRCSRSWTSYKQLKSLHKRNSELVSEALQQFLS